MFNTDVDFNRLEISDILKSALKNEKAASDNYKVIADLFKTARNVVIRRLMVA